MKDHEYAVLEDISGSASREDAVHGEREDLLEGPVYRGMPDCDNLVSEEGAAGKDDDIIPDECEEFVAEKGFVCEDGALDGDNLLESIERTITQITQDLQDSLDRQWGTCTHS